MIFELPNEARVNSKDILAELTAALGFEPEFQILQEAQIETKVHAPGDEELIVKGFIFEIGVEKKQDVNKVKQVLGSHSPEMTDREAQRADYLEKKNAARAADILAALDDPTVVAALKAKLAER